MGRNSSGVRGGGRSSRDLYNGVTSRVSGKLQLQGIGEVSAVRGGDLRVGDTTMWNYGYTDKVTGIKDAKSQVVLTLTNSKGRTAERRINKSRMVGVVTADNAWMTRKD